MTQAKELQADNFSTAMVKYQDRYLGMIEEQFIKHRIVMTDYQKYCAMNAMYAINEVLKANGLDFSSEGLDQSSLTGILQAVTALKLNAGAQPREVYFQIRNKNIGRKGQPDKWIKEVEMGIEGNGNDALLRNFGVNIDKVGSPWLVREDDGFLYPEYTGFEMSPPKWKPAGAGVVVRVVYPIRLKDGSVEYLIQEREDVRPNLIAHIANNLMNETFAIAKSRFDATFDEKKKIDLKKRELLDLAASLTLEELLDEPKLRDWISPAWREAQSREQMIIRKMRNNAVKKYPKDFGNIFTSMQYAQMDETYKEVQDEVDDLSKVEVIGLVKDAAEEKKEIPAKTELPRARRPQPVIRQPDPDPVPVKVDTSSERGEYAALSLETTGPDDEYFSEQELEDPGF